MALLTFPSSYCTPLLAATRARLPAGAAARLLLLIGPAGAASGRVAVAAVCSRAAASARTRCSGGGDQASPAPEPLTLETFATLGKELEYWLANPPESKEDFNKISITASNCMGLYNRLMSHFPAGIIPQEIFTIGKIDKTFVELHKQSTGEDPRADVGIIEAAIKAIRRLEEIYLEGP